MVVVALCALVAQRAAEARAQSASAGEAVLARRVSIDLADAHLHEALTLLRRGLGVPLAWSGDALPPDFRVTVTLRDVPLRNAFAALLAGSGLDIFVTRLGTIVIVRSVAGGPSRTATPGPTEPPDVHQALMATGVHQLDRVVVMGSAVASAPEREQPTAVGVVGPRRLVELSLARVTDVIRRELPGVIFWDRGSIGPPAPIAAVRGIASFSTRAVKTYVDGIELASPELFTLVDARSVERIELIRGPQGAALYGPDALNGILQIETRRGTLGDSATGSRLQPSAGAFDRDAAPGTRATHAGTRPVHDYAGGLEVSGQRTAFSVAGAFANVSSGTAAPLLRSWSASAGGRALLGTFALDASARVARHEYQSEPTAATANTANESVPQELEERALGVTAVHQATPRWRQTLVLGQHWISGAREPFRSALLPPRLPVGASHETASRVSARYGSSIELPRDVTLSGGAEHSQRHVDRAIRRTVTSTDVARISTDELQATGLFGQVRARFGGRFIASAGSRAEWISSVEPELGAIGAHTAGLTWSHEFDQATVRLRAAWGSGIRPPEPGTNRADSTSALVQLANPDLQPERQQGIEGGADVFFTGGSTIKVTWYDQRAKDLIQQVLVRDAGRQTRTYRYQNVGVVQNRGVEMESAFELARVTLRTIVHLPRSEVLRVARSYAGELLPGDNLIEVPEAAGSASLRYNGNRVSAEAGATWLGPWTGYDWQLIALVDRQQATERVSPRDYWKRYDGLVRPFITLDVAVRADLTLTLRADNPANSAELVRDNLSPPLGRMVTVGASWRRNYR
jgi:iron complex outermembrane receptor protein